MTSSPLLQVLQNNLGIIRNTFHPDFWSVCILVEELPVHLSVEGDPTRLELLQCVIEDRFVRELEKEIFQLQGISILSP